MEATVRLCEFVCKTILLFQGNLGYLAQVLEDGAQLFGDCPIRLTGMRHLLDLRDRALDTVSQVDDFVCCRVKKAAGSACSAFGVLVHAERPLRLSARVKEKATEDDLDRLPTFSSLTQCILSSVRRVKRSTLGCSNTTERISTQHR
ncbi:hypothetical protein [Dinoroseobacter sp. S76]|uniref:hypothetical protein n=1 Tax=Dinoroseobacter sp. S76 TaxID=3415124 RepID=UPI003C7D7A77